MNTAQVANVIGRLGEEVTIKVRGQTTENEFGNTSPTFTAERTITVVRDFMNKNTEVEKPFGDRARDNPAFFARVGEAPEHGDRFTYKGTTYQVLSTTEYRSHVELMAEGVVENGD